MGLRDRLSAAKQWMVTPVSLSLVREELPAVIRAGEPARVPIVVAGEDELMTGIDLVLRLQSSGESTDYPLGPVPTTPGRHEVDVVVPTGIPPSFSMATGYLFRVDQRRSRGVTASDHFPVDVVARPQDVYWPDGPRDRPGAEISVVVDMDVVAVGDAVTGQVLVGGGDGELEVEVGATFDRVVGVEGRPNGQQRATYRAQASTRLHGSGALPFSLEIPRGAPPSLSDGLKATVVWEVRATRGKDNASYVFAVVDPEADAGDRHVEKHAFIPFI